MGFLSFLFSSPPHGPAPRMPLRRFSPETQVPPANYTVLDLETTGLDACTCEILELGAIRYRGHKQVEKFHTFIRPEGVIPSRASEINHITWPKVAGAPSLFDIGDAFFDFIGDDTLVGFNIGFDVKFIQTRFGLDIRNVSFDVLPFIKECYPGLFSYKLDELRGYFSLGGTAHSALGDCVATANLLKLCLSTEAGRYIAGQAVENQMRLEEEQVASRARREEARASKTAEKMSSARPKRSIPKTVRPCDITSTATSYDASHPLFGKTVVFTGELSISRQEAMQIAVNLGAVIRGSVSRRTNYLIVGAQDMELVGTDGLSSKEERAYLLNSSGEAHISVIGEDDFFRLVYNIPISAE